MAILRRRSRRTGPAATAQPPEAFEIGVEELAAIERVTRHAERQLRRLGAGDERAIAEGSGAALVPLLHERAGAAHALGRTCIPIRAEEVGLVEAAVLNLESYGGHETVLCEGYMLLNRLAFLKGYARVAREIGGVLTLPKAPSKACC